MNRRCGETASCKSERESEQDQKRRISIPIAKTTQKRWVEPERNWSSVGKSKWNGNTGTWHSSVFPIPIARCLSFFVQYVARALGWTRKGAEGTLTDELKIAQSLSIALWLWVQYHFDNEKGKQLGTETKKKKEKKHVKLECDGFICASLWVSASIQ